jgi:hypothetical protein
MMTMRKYITRKNFDEKNVDPLNAPERTVFFQKNRVNIEQITPIEQSQDNSNQIKSNPSKFTNKLESDSAEKDDISNTLAKKLFGKSFSAIDEFNNEKMKRAYQQLEEEKNILEIK